MQESPSPGIKQEGVKRMGLLSNHESVVWHEFQTGMSTGTIAEAHSAEDWTPEIGRASCRERVFE